MPPSMLVSATVTTSNVATDASTQENNKANDNTTLSNGKEDKSEDQT